MPGLNASPSNGHGDPHHLSRLGQFILLAENLEGAAYIRNGDRRRLAQELAGSVVRNPSQRASGGVEPDPIPQFEVELGKIPITEIKANSQIPQNLREGQRVKIIVKYQLTNNTTLTWETLFVNKTLYIELNNGCLLDASKDAFVALLEYAEEVLMCYHAVLYFPKERAERDTLIRTFLFMGFFTVPPETPFLYIKNPNNVYLVYKLE